MKIRLTMFRKNPSAGLADISLFVVILLIKTFNFLLQTMDPEHGLPWNLGRGTSLVMGPSIQKFIMVQVFLQYFAYVFCSNEYIEYIVKG